MAHTIPACDFEASLRVLYAGRVVPSPKVTHLETGRTKVLASGLPGLALVYCFKPSGTGVFAALGYGEFTFMYMRNEQKGWGAKVYPRSLAS